MANARAAAEPVSTQVVPRDRHAELLSAIALAGAGLERFATEIRHLQRTEVREVEEPFRKGQKGSSAMPHKRNPVVCERICGLARVLRGNAQVGLENVALWHERDITHSSAERIVLPDSTILLDQLLALTLRVVRGMTVHADRMLANLEITSGALFSQRVLLALVASGMQRDDAYRIVQRLGQQAWDTQTPLRTLLERGEGRTSTSTRSSTTATTCATCRGAGAAGGDPIAVLIYGAPETLGDALPRDPRRDRRPVPVPRERRPPRGDGLGARRRQGLRARRRGASIRPRSAATTWSPRAWTALHDRGRDRAARRARSWASPTAIVPPEFPLVRRRPPARERPRADGRRRRVRRAAAASSPRPSSRASGARRRPPTRRWASRASLIRELRAGPHLRGGARGDAGRVAEEHGCELPDDVIVSHGAQSAHRARVRLRRDPRRRAGGGRHLAARQALRAAAPT